MPESCIKRVALLFSGGPAPAANAVISHNKDRLGKNLWTDAGKGENLRIYAASTDEDEAQFIIDEAKTPEVSSPASIAR